MEEAKEVICEFCHKGIFGTDSEYEAKRHKRMRTRYHEGCKRKLNALKKRIKKSTRSVAS